MMAEKYAKGTTTKKAIGDFMISDTHAVNVKSNNLEKQNYSPNIISIKRMHEWIFEEKNNLSFIFVDYREVGDAVKIEFESALIPIEHISWDCLSIEAQGYGVIQMPFARKIDPQQTKAGFYVGFLAAYKKYKDKEIKKHEKFTKRLISDGDSINW